MIRYDSVSHAQPQSGSAMTESCRKEGVECAIDFQFVHPSAVVCDRDVSESVGTGRTDLDTSGVSRRLRCIPDDIEQRLFQFDRAAQDRKRPLDAARIERGPLTPRIIIRLLTNSLEYRCEIFFRLRGRLIACELKIVPKIGIDAAMTGWRSRKIVAQPLP